MEHYPLEGSLKKGQARRNPEGPLDRKVLPTPPKDNKCSTSKNKNSAYKEHVPRKDKSNAAFDHAHTHTPKKTERHNKTKSKGTKKDPLGKVVDYASALCSNSALYPLLRSPRPRPPWPVPPSGPGPACHPRSSRCTRSTPRNAYIFFWQITCMATHTHTVDYMFVLPTYEYIYIYICSMTYDMFFLCIVSDASNPPRLRPVGPEAVEAGVVAALRLVQRRTGHATKGGLVDSPASRRWNGGAGLVKIYGPPLGRLWDPSHKGPNNLLTN